MRISDWSSDVCSSDLIHCSVRPSIQVSSTSVSGGCAAAVLAAAMRSRGIIGARSEEHTSELQSLMRISYAVFCLKKKKYQSRPTNTIHEITANSKDTDSNATVLISRTREIATTT